ncbi:MAG: hypothetical protein JWO92_1202 [Chitinophagaceae bacterium]|nr:hypothetical protein [Chitinophagaceae bacterium]
MEDNFQIPVVYLGHELQFNARLLQSGYIHKFDVDVNGHQVFVEKDDEGNYRAVLADITSENKIDKSLIKAIVESIKEILK